MKSLSIIVVTLLLGFVSEVHSQTDFQNRSRFMFDEIRANALERSRQKQQAENPQGSSVQQPAIIVESAVVPPLQPEQTTVTPVTQSGLPSSLPPRVFVEDSSIGFFPDSPNSNSITQTVPGVSTSSVNQVSSSSLPIAQTFPIVPQESVALTPPQIQPVRQDIVVSQPSAEPISTNAITREIVQPDLPAPNIPGSPAGSDSSTLVATDVLDSEESSEFDIQKMLNERAPVREILSSNYESPTSDYTIHPGDTLSIEVFQEPDLSREMKVAASGEVTFPLLGQVMVAGKSAAQAERYMRDLLEKDYLVHPHVIINVKEFKNEQVSVQGYVNIPKLITLPPDQPMTILQAISEAGGLQRIGNPNKIELIRQGEPNRVFKLNDLKSVADPSQIIYLKPNDVVYVSERGLF
jgi:polysaccharide biosynthesis/export protein